MCCTCPTLLDCFVVVVVVMEAISVYMSEYNSVLGGNKRLYFGWLYFHEIAILITVWNLIRLNSFYLDILKTIVISAFSFFLLDCQLPDITWKKSPITISLHFYFLIQPCLQIHYNIIMIMLFQWKKKKRQNLGLVRIKKRDSLSLTFSE